MTTSSALTSAVCESSYLCHFASAAAPLPPLYDCVAVSNHYGSTGGGHYTAFAKHSQSAQWHKFDDSHTAVVEPKDVVTPAAYVLMYCRRAHPSRASPEM